MNHVFTGVLLNLDGVPDISGEAMAKDAEVHLQEEVPVTLGFETDEVVGKARVFRDGDQIKYEMELDGKTSRELYGQLAPCAGGHVKRRLGNEILEATIFSIGLSNQNTDSRIKKLT